MNSRPCPKNWNNSDAPGETHPKGGFTRTLPGSDGTQLALKALPNRESRFIECWRRELTAEIRPGRGRSSFRRSSGGLKSFHAEEALEFMVGDLHSVVAIRFENSSFLTLRVLGYKP
jgi:hypothetical protein